MFFYSFLMNVSCSELASEWNCSTWKKWKSVRSLWCAWKGSTAKMYGFEGVSAPVRVLRVAAEGHPLSLGGRRSLNAKEGTSFQGGTCRGWELDPACLDSLFSGLITGSVFPALTCCWTVMLPRLRDVTTEWYSSFSGAFQLLVRFAVLPRTGQLHVQMLHRTLHCRDDHLGVSPSAPMQL